MQNNNVKLFRVYTAQIMKKHSKKVYQILEVCKKIDQFMKPTYLILFNLFGLIILVLLDLMDRFDSVAKFKN